MAFSHRFTRVGLAVVTAVCLTAGSVTATAAPADETTGTRITADQPTTRSTAGDNSSDGDNKQGNHKKDDTSPTNGKRKKRPGPVLTPKVAPYKNPGLSSSPSSNEPGLSYQLRGLSSKIIDPIGGFQTVLIIIVALMWAKKIHDEVRAGQVRAAIAHGQPIPEDPFSSAELPTLDSLSSSLSERLPQLPGAPR